MRRWDCNREFRRFSFYQISRAIELKILLHWETTRSNFNRLRNTLSKPSAGVLGVTFEGSDGPTGNILMDKHYFRFNGPIVCDAMAFY